jgi:lipid II:glycine glycyltransferase (peptidoglycan interpeptide bridge formation enzyme)
MAKESGFVLQASPTIGDINAFKSHVRTNSDVQGLVKRFEHLDVRDRDAESNERRKKLEAELRRAQIAREEAESDAKKLREESRKLKREVEEGKDRERRVGKRLEVVMVGVA